jgi:site-specific DNA-methyltransferase (cytosine-N4-specific)
VPDDLTAPVALYGTPLGTAYAGDSLEGMTSVIEDGSVSLVMTSPPFSLSRKKEYGNKQEHEYISWFRDFAAVIWDKLRDDGSFVIDLGGAWRKGRPVRSLYQFKLLIELCEKLGDKNFNLAQEFYWYNPSKMPLPAQWVNVDRVRVKDSVNVIWWLSKSDTPKANNGNVLRPYSRDMERLLERQSYNGGRRPGGAKVNHESWKKRHNGAIPPNVMELPFVTEPDDSELPENFLRVGGSESNSRYHRAYTALQARYAPDTSLLRERARKHPARFPLQIPRFFIDFLTDEGDLVVDPFAGSNVTGQAAEEGGRRWTSFELHRYYLEPSVARFDAYFSGDLDWLDDLPPLMDDLDPAARDELAIS